MGSTTASMLGGLALGIGIASCGQLAADGGDAPSSLAGEGVPTYASGTIGATCGDLFAECQYVIRQCTGDPTCAHWYQCVSRCAVSDQNCPGNCTSKLGPGAVGDSVRSCMDDHPCLPGWHEAGGSAGFGGQGAGGNSQAGGAGGSSVTPGVDASIPNNEGGVDAPMPCSECLSTCCEQAAPVADISCPSYIGFYSNCRSQTETEAGLEKCLYTKATSADGAAYYKAIVESGAMRCLGTTCESCVSTEYVGCHDCLINSCYDQFSAVLGNPEALSYVWCRAQCESPSGANADCPSKCDKYDGGLSEGADLISCRNSYCMDSCSLSAAGL